MAEATQCQTLKKGDEFSSLVHLEEAIKKFEDNENCNLSKFNTRTIEGAKRKGLKRHINPELEYACLNYMCVQGGEYKSRSNEIRPNQSSYRLKCPVMICVRPNDIGDKLVITSIVTEHNHIRSKAIFDHYPSQRRLDSDAKSIASKLVVMKVNKKILKNKLMAQHNKVITLKDIHNLALTNSPKLDALKSLVESFKNKQGGTLEILKNNNNELKAIFYQDDEMKRIFALCPEVLFVDAIYKVNDLRLPLYVFLGLYQGPEPTNISSKHLEDQLLIRTNKMFEKKEKRLQISELETNTSIKRKKK